MNQISLSDADGLISKLLTERVRVVGHFITSSGAEAQINGFIDSKNSDGTVVVSSSGPPIKTEQGYFRIWIAGPKTVIWYGEAREIPPHMKQLAEHFGKSVLLFDIGDFREQAALFFTID